MVIEECGGVGACPVRRQERRGQLRVAEQERPPGVDQPEPDGVGGLVGGERLVAGRAVRIDVVSDGGYIARGTEVVVVRSEGYRHIVRAGA